MKLVPITIKEANRYVARWHRHSGTARALCAIGAQRDGAVDLCGVAIIGRPVARLLQDGRTCEVVRVATDGSPNVCSWLYARCRRVAQALGYTRCVTYTHEAESGGSLRALGLEPAAKVKPDDGNRPGRPRTPKPRVAKLRWELLPPNAAPAAPREL